MNNSEQLAQQLLEQLNTTFSQAVQAIRTQAYAEGYRDAALSSADHREEIPQQPQEVAGGDMVELDLELPSGTIWLRPKDLDEKGVMSIKKAMESGYKLPTEEQIQELLHCQFFGFVFRKPSVRGCNGRKFTLTETVTPCALIASSDEVGSDLRIHTRLLKCNYTDKSYEWHSGFSFIGEPVKPLFVRSLEA